MPKVQEEKKKYKPKGKTLAELAAEVKPLIAEKKSLEARVEELKSAIHTITVLAMPPLMEDLEGDSVNIKDVALLELETEVYPYVNKDDYDTFLDWLDENGNGPLAKRSVHPKTFQAFVNEQLAQNVKLPDFIKVGLVPTVKVKAPRKGK